MTTLVLMVAPLIVVLYVLIVSINKGEHYAPQAYYRAKRGGAPVAYGFESLGPRPRRRGALETAAEREEVDRSARRAR